MVATQDPYPSSGRAVSGAADCAALEEAVGDRAFVDRLRALVDEAAGRDEPLRALLALGADWLGVEEGLLTRIDPAAGTHEVEMVAGPNPTAAAGTRRDLSDTFCRQVMAGNAALALGNAPEQGWAGDPAVEAFGPAYVGAKVVVDGALHGTLCLLSRTPLHPPPGEAAAAAVELLARAAGRLLAGAAAAEPNVAQLSVLFEQSPNMINIHDAAGTLLAPNPRLCEVTGYTREELTGMKVWNLDEKASPDAARTFWAGLTPGDRAEWEGRYRCKDGSTVPVEVHLRCVERDGDVRFVAIGRDIRARTETQQALEEERDLLNRILETSPAAIVVLNADGDFLEASGRAQEVLGLEKDEVTQRTFDDPDWQIRGPDGGPMPEEELPFTRVMATGEPVHDVEHQIAWPDGTRRLLSVSGAPLRSADGDLEGAVFHLDDVTERRAAEKGLREREARLRQREAQLREERDRFATLFHNLDTPVVHGRATEEGRLQVEAVNERFEATFGYEDDATRGADLQGLIVPPHEEESAALMRRQLLQGVAVDREVQRRAVDGLRDFRVQVALRRDDDGRPTEGFAIYTDITERRNRERRLARRRALLAAQAEASLDGLLVVNADREVSFHNDRFCEIWRLPTPLEASGGEAVSAEAVLLDAVADLLPDPEIFRTEVEYLYDHPHEESRTLVQLTDGRWLDRYSAPVVGDDGHPFGRLWVFRDVTRQRQMLEQLLEVQEEERRRIDQEIHDEMGGLLTSLQLTIDLARRDVQQGGDALASFDQLEGLVSELSSVSRTISRKLFPSDLSEKGLREGLATLVEEVQADHALSVELYSEIGPDDPVPLLVERTVYWIVQEALLNVARHATADATQVILNKRGKQLYLHIFDEGAGVSQAAQERGRSLQVDAIRRRVEWLNGEVRIDSIPDEGVRLSVVLPLRLPYLIGGGGAGAEPGGNSPADPAV